MTLRISIVTIFPEFFTAPLSLSIPARAAAAGVVSYRVVDLRDFTHDRHRTVDDYAFGGGPGMVMKPEPFFEAVDAVGAREPIVLVSARGRPFAQADAVRYAGGDELTILCGHYKDVDQRVAEHLATEEISLGDYVLSGGEPAALAIVDATVRLLPGAMSDIESAYTDSFWREGLSAPSYTRPAEYRGHEVPEVLLSGDHKRIAEWRAREAARLTAGRAARPELATRSGRRAGRPAPRTETTPGAMIESINPATGETLERYAALTAAEIEERVQRATTTFAAWRSGSFAERSALMTAAAELLEGEKERWGRMMTLEMGKPIQAGRDEAAKCAWACRYYAERAESLLADEEVETNATRSYIAYQPLGPVLAVMPWNFPFWQVFRFAAPALMAGNVGLLKHASNVPQCALAIEEIFRRAGFPEGVFQTLLVGSDAVGPLLADARIAAVTLTGSEGAGSVVGAEAGRAIKKSVLELGGSDPFVVMPSADLESAVATAIAARTVNNGQSCIAAKRFIVHEAIADEFERRFAAGMRSLRVGDPMDPETQVGPLATAAILADLDRQVKRSVMAGARLVVGGERIERPGNFYQPTVLADIPADAPAFGEELFGPVAALFRVPDIQAAVRLANATSFGLGSSVWTEDEEERRVFIADVQAGLVFINGMVASDPRLPFGGVKRSGYGRELGAFGIREFVNIKSVWIGEGRRTNRTATE